jgi:hypothetical protein
MNKFNKNKFRLICGFSIFAAGSSCAASSSSFWVPGYPERTEEMVRRFLERTTTKSPNFDWFKKYDVRVSSRKQEIDRLKDEIDSYSRRGTLGQDFLQQYVQRQEVKIARLEAEIAGIETGTKFAICSTGIRFTRQIPKPAKELILDFMPTCKQVVEYESVKVDLCAMVFMPDGSCFAANGGTVQRYDGQRLDDFLTVIGGNSSENLSSPGFIEVNLRSNGDALVKLTETFGSFVAFFKEIRVYRMAEDGNITPVAQVFI